MKHRFVSHTAVQQQQGVNTEAVVIVVLWSKNQRFKTGGEPEVLPHEHKSLSFSETLVQPGVEPEVAMPSCAKPAFARRGDIPMYFLYNWRSPPILGAVVGPKVTHWITG